MQLKNYDCTIGSSIQLMAIYSCLRFDFCCQLKDPSDVLVTGMLIK